MSLITGVGAFLAMTQAARFENAAPLPTIPGVMMDSIGNGYGLAQQTARAGNLQARIMWIDGTANIDQYNTPAKIHDLMAKIHEVGFNTVVFDVKPISGQVIYASKIAPKIKEWKGRALPEDFDPLGPMVKEAHANGLSIFVSLNAFSEGHQLFKVGPGYDKKDWQTVLYDTQGMLKTPFGGSFTLGSTLDKTVVGQLGMYSSAAKMPKAEGFALTLQPDLTVVDGFEIGTMGPDFPSVPKGGKILYGTGAAADFLRLNVRPGEKLSFDTQPLFVSASDRPGAQIPLMMNPNNPDVVAYETSIAKELATNYPIDGIIYDDRLRYSGINADFSDLTKAKFETQLNKKLNWPDDVFKFTLTPSLSRGIQPGRYYDQWMAFRAGVLTDYIAQVRKEITAIRPSIQLGIYVGSWYGEYPALGNNYASDGIEAGFWFLTNKYRSKGMASNLDLLITGCYYQVPTIYDAMAKAQPIGRTVEAAGILSNRLAGDQAWTYAGISLSDFEGNPDGLKEVLQAACASTQGVMIFDLSHNIEPMWPVFKQAFGQARKAPHMSKGTLADVRRRRALLDKMGVKAPPITIATGASGVGQ